MLDQLKDHAGDAMNQLSINSKNYQILDIDLNWYEVVLKDESKQKGKYCQLDIHDDEGDECIEPFTYIRLPVIMEECLSGDESSPEMMEISETMKLFDIDEQDCEGWILFKDSWEADCDCFYHLP